MLKFISENARRATLDEPCNVSWQRVRIASDEQMDMIRLDGEHFDLPSVLIDYFLNNLFQAVMHRTYQDFSPPFGAPNDMVDKQVDRVLFMNILMFHVDSMRYSYMDYQHLGPQCSSPKQGRPVHPRFIKNRAFLAACCNGHPPRSPLHLGLLTQ
jgi:hypothetical protein